MTYEEAKKMTDKDMVHSICYDKKEEEFKVMTDCIIENPVITPEKIILKATSDTYIFLPGEDSIDLFVEEWGAKVMCQYLNDHKDQVNEKEYEQI